MADRRAGGVFEPREQEISGGGGRIADGEPWASALSSRVPPQCSLPGTERHPRPRTHRRARRSRFSQPASTLSPPVPGLQSPGLLVPAFQYGDPSAFEPLSSSTLPRDSIAALGAAPQTPSPAPRAQPGTSSVAGHRRGLPATRQPSHVSCPQSLSCSCDGFDQLFLSRRRV